MNRDILQVIRVMLRDYQLDEKEWDYLLPVVQPNLNQTPAVSLANKSPMEHFTALNPTTPLDVVVVGMNKDLCELKWQHKDIQKNLDDLRTKDFDASNVTEGDYVLCSRLDERYHPKCSSHGSPQRKAHTPCVKMYSRASFEVAEEIREHFVPDVSEFMLEVFWEGFEDFDSS
ncbi:hypothetical protein H257_08137 [Aphanomyces astaci]|uniref:Uncharacterized protein n=1 Tax=Aphanomyces astaci TaxID=112090 RepID=W4GH94_APHAT|nr:hypothetical protein H257_08137 [Aphanomyces astaci]ETV78646.1 hypothetical protein H257_08137 [Aphanomyces astaci]|eukprot:XP_009832227.1 hypothetical protein H257_08137 [Aphanomyces astaci]